MKFLCWSLCWLLPLVVWANPSLTVAHIFSDNMVLQHGIRVPVWGTAAAGAKVTVSFGKQTVSAVAAADGRWLAKLEPLASSYDDQTLQVSAGGETIRFLQILVGDVWICGGQSNMEMPVGGWGGVLNYQREIRHAHYPAIRMLTVQHVWSAQPNPDIQANSWQICTPETVKDFSAVAFFFGREIYKSNNTPVGLISCNWGGTPAEAWMSVEALKAFPEFGKRIELVRTAPKPEQALEALYQQELKEWSARLVKANAAADAHWHETTVSPDGWLPMELPMLWEKAGLGDIDGVVWFRKTVELPATWQGKPVTLHLGPVDDIDQTWVNGQQVGSMGRYDAPRIYTVAPPAGTTSLAIAVKVYDTGGGGGLWGQPDSMYLACEGEKLPLAGIWKSRLAFAATPALSPPESPNIHYTPGVLYNGMLRPLMPYAIKGVIWYQGESNVPRAWQYRSLFPAMIQNWRTDWGQGDFPFIFTQLANYSATVTEPAADAWAELREAQRQTLQLPNTGMAVAIDIGDANDIHPKNKQEVGRRLALVALKKVYLKDTPHSGPVFKNMTIDGNHIKLTFDYADSLYIQGDKQHCFMVAGKDQTFFWANVLIEGNTVTLICPKVAHPVAVRYAWAANPAAVLYNADNLPASPFCTDQWKWVTKSKK